MLVSTVITGNYKAYATFCPRSILQKSIAGGSLRIGSRTVVQASSGGRGSMGVWGLRVSGGALGRGRCTGRCGRHGRGGRGGL